MHLTGSLNKSLPLDVELAVEPGHRVALIGPNGAGKTTVMRILAGLETPMPGSTITVGDTVLVSDRVNLPTHERRTPTTFAEPRLFPGLTVLDNLVFGTMRGKRPNAQARERARIAAGELGITSLLDRKATQLSSGQSAAVAILRSILAEPRVIVLDEPFSALDTSVATETRALVHRQLEKLDAPLVMATHTPLDVMTLATHVGVIEKGTLTQYGPVAEVARYPKSRFAARFLGLNLLRGVADGDRVRVEDTLDLRTVTPTQSEVWLAFAPQSVTLSSEQPYGSAQNRWATTVSSLEHLESTVRVSCVDPVPIRADITATAAIDLKLGLGKPIWLSVKATAIEVYDA